MPLVPGDFEKELDSPDLTRIRSGLVSILYHLDVTCRKGSVPERIVRLRGMNPRNACARTSDCTRPAPRFCDGP